MDRRTEIVQRGYDRIGQDYAEWRSTHGPDVRGAYLERVCSSLTAGARVLDLGCGTGAHATAALAASYEVVGVDLSVQSLERARAVMRDVPLVQADITTVGFKPQSFDAVVAFYSLIHVPREDHAHVLAAVATWLRPGGWFVGSFGARTGSDGEGEFLGASMYWSSWDEATTLRLVREAGLDVVSARRETEDEDGRPVEHFWIVAR